MQYSGPTFPDRLGAFDARRTPVLQTDVLVIGAGIAGAAAALRAAEQGASVLCVSKTPFADANTAWAMGGVAAVLKAEDSFALHLEDTLRVGAGLTCREIAESIITKGPESVRWLEEVGARFDRGADGALQLGREGGHSVHRIVHANGDATGLEIERALSEALLTHPRILCKLGHFVRDLLVSDGRCVGAMLQADDLELAVHAGSVILAAGGAGQVFRETTNPIGATGDGPALAFRAGAILSDMEFFQFHPTVLYIAGASRFLISEVVRGAGALLQDGKGRRFMPDVHPDAELAPRDVVSRAILDQMVSTGDTHVYLNLSTVPGDPHRKFPSISRICRAFDFDIARDPVPVRPGAHYLIGGVHVDAEGRSNVPGLFAVGEAAASSLHGANRLASNSLLEGAVLGSAAGRTAAGEAALHRLPEPQETDSDGDLAPRLQLEDMLYSLKSLMWRQVGLARDQLGLDRAIHRIGLWSHYLAKSRPSDRRAHELQNMLTTSALIAEAASVRAESRGTHFRTDHAARNDADWSRHVFQHRAADGSIAATLGPVFQPSDKPVTTR